MRQSTIRCDGASYSHALVDWQAPVSTTVPNFFADRNRWSRFVLGKGIVRTPSPFKDDDAVEGQVLDWGTGFVETDEKRIALPDRKGRFTSVTYWRIQSN